MEEAPAEQVQRTTGQTRSGASLRIVLCWPGFSGYMAACWKALAARPGVQLSVLTMATRNYSLDLMDGLDAKVLSHAEFSDPAANHNWVTSRQPNVVMIGGWTYPVWNALPHLPELAGTRFLLGFDTPWRALLRQRLARFKLSRLLSRIDRLVVPGERGFQYGLRLGFPDSRISRGFYGYDDAPLAALHARRQAAGWPKRFLYMGRFAPEKALDVMVEAYKRYRSRVPSPWDLTCYGFGPLEHLLAGVDGICNRGFVQPTGQPAVWAEHGAFVFPSRYEPWGVAIAEAAASGLPVICTEACGASPEIVRHMYTGMVVGTDDPASLASAMEWVDRNHDRCPEMGRRGRVLAEAFAAPLWAERWERMARELVEGR